MSTLPASVEQGLQAAGVGKFQYRLFVIFGLVWLADAMQVLSIGFSAPTIAKTFGLTVPQALQTGTMFFVGMLLGAFVFGRLADRIGRRPVLMGAVVIDACFGVASAFAPDFTWLLALRLLTGIGVGGTLPVDYTMMAEFLPSARRGRWLVMLESFWAIGTICLAVLALVAVSWGNDAWRVIFFVTGLPALVGVVLRFYVPESPMYLNRSGKSDAARQVLERVAKVNGSSTPIPPLQPEVVERKPMSALFSAALRRRSLSLYLAWGLISIAYYGVFVYLPVKLGSEGFGFMRGQIFLIFLALVQLPGYALSAYGVERWGRKPTLVGFLVLSAVGCMLYSLGKDPMLVVGSTLLLSFSLLGTWAALYAFTPEVYPTDLRASGMGTAGAVARFGGLFAPAIVAPVMASHFTLALAMLSAFLVAGAVAILCVDVESRNRALE
ncbi:MFS transporter [Herbaspirillum seropedicae]|uniref:Permease of the major facilitator superfamily protein n=1 Tax=Herbaspirillum seropedicae (strain SmR1) TaxID=757424 RepID=D8IP30_HERSS|nr:MFS transporter [Herbaspirillum seropedicae]ADJ62850.1 permease of the major facilitator superfamily protein [Herbaspirillum seropedicae SmR1]AKN64940.1 MFS transporter [Herbaspirillum seropedicae]NQE31255.1 MFS transporter [Herbaspirillum seropedicae]QDD63807.1 MFS transporter [Herbaspirillum seropedicae]UMU20885.1 MFS transporter [Herbaspirillum seropedicae]